jgi:hypothetical protein
MLFPELEESWCPEWIANKMREGMVTMEGAPGEMTEKAPEPEREEAIF